MTDTGLDLAELVSSRICHDVISPVGAIDNGLELLCMAGGSTGPEMNLIAESATNASARIRFFRVAFGAAGDQVIGAREITTILSDLYQGSKLSVDWRPQEAQKRAGVRQAFVGLLCMETALPHGGTIHVDREDGCWLLTARAETFQVDPDLWGLLEGRARDAPLVPSQVQFGLLPSLVAKAGAGGIAVRSAPGELTLRF